MSLASGCQPQQMYPALTRDFYHQQPQPLPLQHQQQHQQRYLPSMETLSAAAASAGLHVVSSPNAASAIDPSSNGPYFQNLIFPGPHYTASDYSTAAGLPSTGTELNHGPAAEPFAHSSGLYVTPYDDLSLMIPGAVIDDGVVPRVRTVKRRVSSNRKERRRTHSINTAFAALRGCIPNVPSDTKLSKIKTLRLATSYIAYLMDILNKDDPKLAEGGFKADISRKIESREEKRKRESEEILKAISAHSEEKPSRGRTGWPQQVWAAELKQ